MRITTVVPAGTLMTSVYRSSPPRLLPPVGGGPNPPATITCCGSTCRWNGWSFTLGLISVHSSKRWRDSALAATDDKKALERAKIEQLERTYWFAWESSTKPREVTTQEKKEPGGMA